MRRGYHYQSREQQRQRGPCETYHIVESTSTKTTCFELVNFFVVQQEKVVVRIYHKTCSAKVSHTRLSHTKVYAIVRMSLIRMSHDIHSPYLASR